MVKMSRQQLREENRTFRVISYFGLHQANEKTLNRDVDFTNDKKLHEKADRWIAQHQR